MSINAASADHLEIEEKHLRMLYVMNYFLQEEKSRITFENFWTPDLHFRNETHSPSHNNKFLTSFNYLLLTNSKTQNIPPWT